MDTPQPTLALPQTAPPRLSDIRDALEGAIPAVMATSDAQGVPNVAFLSQVHYVDGQHVALSYQFFNKTRRNILANPQAHLAVVHPRTAAMYRMRLRYLRTEGEGTLFERMRAHLEGIASHTGMAGVFRLLGADIYRVEQLEAVPGGTLDDPEPARQHLSALRRTAEALAGSADFAGLVDTTLDALVRDFGFEHAMFLMLDEPGQRLYTVGTRGYPASGVGAEIMLGDGVIGTCARARTAIRVNWLTQAYRYSMAARDRLVHDGLGHQLTTEIPYPGLAEPHSQLGVPIVHGARVLGVLFVESAGELRMRYDDEDALVVLGAQLGASIEALHSAGVAAEVELATVAQGAEPDAGAGPPECPDSTCDAPLRVRHFPGNDSVFLDDQYLIKGVAGAIFWRLVSEYNASGRTAFSNRELRLDPRIRLPEVADNLEARLILLRRRLAEQDAGVQLLKAGRGLLTLQLRRPLVLVSEAG